MTSGRKRGRRAAGSGPPDAAAAEFMAAYSGISVIGHGPCATVYGAVETESSRPVALKVFNAGGEAADTIFRDARSLRRLRAQPNILVPERFGSTEEGHPVVVSDLCRASMKQIASEAGAVPPRTATDVAIKMAGALADLHEQGMLHLNVKPQNFLLTLMEEAKLADLGEFSFRTSMRSLEDPAMFSAVHAAPEMFEDGELSPATDIYGLASSLYELLVGRAPFEPFGSEGSASIVLRILRDPVTPLRSETVPYRLAQAVEAGLTKDRDERPQSASAFADELRAVAAEEGWSAAVPASRLAAGNFPASSDPSSADPDPSTREAPPLPRLTRPRSSNRNVVVPEGGRRGSMDRPPRRS